jgi:drug/metabolite transporter (DMT)-like permease
MALSHRTKVLAAFITLYIVWGATFLGMRYAVAEIPPMLMAGTRFVISGLLMYAFVRQRGEPNPTPTQWRAAAIAGTLLIIGNTATAAATRRIPSGVTGLFVGLTPCWFVLFDWMRPKGVAPRPEVIFGLLGGLAGIALLVGPSRLTGTESLDLIGVAAVIIGSLIWAAGSIYSRYAPRTDSAIMMTAAQLLVGGAVVTIAAVLTGDLSGFHVSAVTSRGWLAYGYLIAFGSFLGFTAYTYILKESTPARIATYAYVNPIVAVFVGWALGGEPLTRRVLISAAIIIGAVVMITTAGTTTRAERA